MAQPGTPSRITLAIIWLLLGLVMIGVPAWLGWTRWSAILNAHPLGLAAVIVCGLLGFVAVAWSIASLAMGGRHDREGDPERPRRRTEKQVRRRAVVRIVFAIPALLFCLALVGGLAWLRPIPATAGAARAMASADDVTVTDFVNWYELRGVQRDSSGNAVKPTTGLVFVPEERVDPRAYAALLHPLAKAGYIVAVIKEPLGQPRFNAVDLNDVISVYPEIKYWAVGGHGAGGATAAAFAQTHPVGGLVLYGALPMRQIDRANLAALSITGAEDRTVTPDMVTAAQSDLPAATTRIQLPGAGHGAFGDYVGSVTDGRGATDGSFAAQIVQPTQKLLAALTPPPKPKKK